MNLYNYRDITKLLEQAGFSVEKAAPEFIDDDFDPDNPNCKRIVLLSRKI